jgi:type IV pilus assembly protein PilC
MPKYFFVAKSLEGQTKTGQREAKDIHQLASTLRQEGLVLIRAEVEKEERRFKISFPSFGVSLSEKMFFTRNLEVMISAGIPLPKAISSLKEQAKNKRFKKALEKIEEEIKKGTRFSDALSEFPQIFNEFYQSMIKVAEETGNLEEVLGILARQMERENEMKSKIIGALIYPAVVVLAMFGIGILMLIMVVPKLAETFKELEIELPLTTKIVIGLGNFLSQKWYLFFGILFFLVFFFFQILKTKAVKKIFDRISLKIPIISGIIQKTNSASTARNLSSLISGGVSLPRALEITANTLGNFLYKEALFSAVEKVKKGEKLSLALKPYQKIYPLTLISMIEVGEETGATSEILSKLAEFYEEEVSNATKNLVSVIEPVLMLFIGGVVGFFAISMVQPMYSMLQGIK